MVLKRQKQSRDYYRNLSEEEKEKKKNDQNWIKKHVWQEKKKKEITKTLLESKNNSMID